MAVASGKVILLGEHAVVYGYPALVAGIENGAEATVSVAETSTITVGEGTEPSTQGALQNAFQALAAVLQSPPLRAHVRLNIPAGCGLGASAAAGVALARATLDLHDPVTTETAERRAAILSAANAWERVFHGNPSGIDATAAILGGCFAFDRQNGAASLELGQPLQLAVAIADAPAETRVLVGRVAEQRGREPERVDSIMQQIAGRVQLARLAIAHDVRQQLGQLMNENHCLLQQLGVSTPRLDQACAVARDAGALGAKLTGSGGGGCVIALCETYSTAVMQAWRARGLTCFSMTIPGRQ